MTTWADLTAQLTLLLDNDTGTSDAGPTYPDDLRRLAWKRACETFAISHTALLKTVTVTPVKDGDGVSINLPDDWISMGGIRVKTDALLGDPIILPIQVNHGGATSNMWLRPTLMTPGTWEDRTGYVLTGDRIYMADTKINTCVLWYYSFYPDVVLASDVLKAPRWSEWALQNLTISYLLIPPSIGVADLRRYETKLDAGSPEDNPSRVQANHHLKIYIDLVSKVQSVPRTLFYDTHE